MDPIAVQDIYDQWLVGITAFVTLVSLIQCWLSRDKSYLWYGIYVGLNGLYFGIFAFRVYNIYPAHVGYSASSQGPSSELLLISYIAYYYFLISFLQLKILSDKVYRIMRGFAYYLVIATLLHGISVRIFGDFYIGGLSWSEITLITIMPISFVGVYFLLKLNTRLSLIIVTGTLLYLIGSIGGFLRLMFRIWSDGIGTDFLLSTKVGFFLEIVCFSLGLAYRSTLLEREKEETLQYKRLNEMQRTFFANVSHEFRTPLTLIKGMAHRIIAPEKAKVEIEIQSDKLLSLVGRILDLSKVERGDTQLQLRRGDIIAAVRESVQAFQSLADERDVMLIFYGEDASIMMKYDPQFIESITFNLISNAIKYSDRGGKVIVHLREEADQLCWIVKDEGEGIPTDELPYIFDRFHQVPSLKREIGSGIGLALVKEYVHLLGGSINVKSEVGVGSEFIILLPKV